MSNGTVIRCHVGSTAGWWQMLIDSDVTDIVRAGRGARASGHDRRDRPGLYNRRHFLGLADREWVRTLRTKLPISFLMVDIDHFKSINDRSVTGSATPSSCTSRNSRVAAADSDVLARVGGEEFALLLPSTDVEAATGLAERLRIEVTRTRCPDMPNDVVPTVSIGVAAATKEMRDVADLMRAADEALYEAKRSGRNRVVRLQQSGSKKSGLARTRVGGRKLSSSPQSLARST